MRKIFVTGVILLFIGCSVSSGIHTNSTDNPQPLNRGWLYVGGSGPGNYTRIQDAINDSSSGDTIFIYDDSSPYEQHFTIDKSIRVLGENKTTTIIDGRCIVYSNAILISDIHFIDWGPSLVIINFSQIVIENCIISDDAAGIRIDNSTNDIIRNCSFYKCLFLSAIWVGDSRDIDISYCDFFNNTGFEGTGNIIDIVGSRRIMVHHCTGLYNFGFVVGVRTSLGITIQHCNFTDNYLQGGGVSIFASRVNLTLNNFIDNEGPGVEFFYMWPFNLRNNWWGSPRGPSINFTTYLSFLLFNRPFYIRSIENGDTVHFVGITHIGRFFLLIGLLPWLSEPVPDAGSRR